MSRPTRALVNLAAIRHNYRLAKKLSGQRAVAIVKANAYGHGAVRVAQALVAEADAFGVACLEEALELRESGIQLPVLLLEGVFTPDELALAARLDFPVTVHTDVQLEWVLNARPEQPFKVFLKFDTGMHRLGFAPARARELYNKLKQCAHVASVTLMTHFASADETENPFTATQLQRFQRVCGDLPAEHCLANSAAVLNWPETHGNWVRPGIMLYGADPLDKATDNSRQLQPAMTLQSELIAVRSLEAGERIGYGGRYECRQTTRVGVVAIGYADGYPRHVRDGAPVQVKGQDSQIIGRVSMDMLTVDLTAIPHAAVGDPVELWGAHVLANAVAACSDTIAYTLFTGVAPRVYRDYIN